MHPSRHPLPFVAAITLLGGILRFHALDRGVPYHHFHADEYLALLGAEALRIDETLAAESAKFFIYPVLPKRLLGWGVELLQWATHPLDMASRADQINFYLVARSLAAAFGTATVPLVYAVGRRLGGPLAGLAAAFLMATGVLHVRDSHYFTPDPFVVFFCVLTLLLSVIVAAGGSRVATLGAGAAFGAALSSKYSAGFLIVPLLVAHVAAQGPAWRRMSAWRTGVMRTAVAGLAAVAVFVVINPLVLQYPARVWADLYHGVVTPNFGDEGPVWTAQFRDVNVWTYWFSNVLPWSHGPGFAVWGLAGTLWLARRPDPLRATVLAYAVTYYLIAGHTTTPYMRYALPWMPALAIGAGVLSADLLRGDTLRRRVGFVATGIVLVSSGLWAEANAHVWRTLDPRIQAARLIHNTIPPGAHILVEPSQGTPPMGSYFTDPVLYEDYVGFGAQRTRVDRYVLHTLDTYQFLFDRRVPVEAKHRYIRERLALADYVVLDDTFMEFYARLHEPEYAPVHEFYRDLFSGRLGFDLLRDFRVHPTLFGLTIDDDAAEMTFRLFDHPDVFVFARRTPR